jgi:2-hydroxychromene-2-carboxylate isomerase
MLRAVVSRGASRVITSARLRDWCRTTQAWGRRVRGAEPTLHYFHQADDPYSHLSAQLLPALCDRYRVRVAPHLVPPPDAGAAPDAERLGRWAGRDAARLAAALQLDAPPFDAPLAPHQVAAAQQALAAALRAGRFVESAAAIGAAAWRGLSVPGSAEAAHAVPLLAAGRELRGRLGHYLGATFFFEGEWYWGVDRLHHLERRLAESGLARPALKLGPAFLASPPPLQFRDAYARGRAPQLHFYGSLRSPYTYLAIARVRRIARHYGADLQLRFVLPMVMRGLPVPMAKRLYILRDAKREAERLGLPFGRAVDPVGPPTERGLAVLHRAIALGRGPAFAESFLQGVFADGIDAGSRRGLHTLAARAGLAPRDVDDAVQDDAWRAVTEANRAEMLALGLWGVPSFRVDDRPALWGQDRLWMLEQDLLDVLADSPVPHEPAR